jgi:hypothetical protein
MPRFCLRFILYVATSLGCPFLFISTFREAFIMSRPGEEDRDLALVGVTRPEERQEKPPVYSVFFQWEKEGVI